MANNEGEKREEDIWANKLNVSVIKQIFYPNDLNSSNTVGMCVIVNDTPCR